MNLKMRSQNILKRRFSTLFALIALMFTLGSVSSLSQAAIEVFEFDNPKQEAQYKALIEEFRCPKCQNQNLAGSDSVISQDLKRKTYEMVMAGQSDAQIREYMYERYGDFISYKPPVRPSTWILWYFPPIILLILVAGWLLRTKANSKRPLAVQNAGDETFKSSEFDLENIGSDLSSEEAQKLKKLLKQHDPAESDSNQK